MKGRPDTADVYDVDTDTWTLAVKRLCNGCHRPLGDLNEEEIDAVFDHEPLPDVRTECGCLIVELQRLLGASGYTHLNEAGLQACIWTRLVDAGLTPYREAWIGSGERIDFLVGRVGIEIKVAGSAADVRRQLARYAATEAVDELLLVTTKAAHRVLHGEVLSDVLITVVAPSWL